MKSIITTLLLSVATLSTLFAQKSKITITGQIKQPVASEVYFLKLSGDLMNRNSILKVNDGKFSFSFEKNLPEVGVLFFNQNLYTYVVSTGSPFSIEVDTTKNRKITFYGAGAKMQELLSTFTQGLDALDPFKNMEILALDLQETENNIEKARIHAQKIIKEVEKDNPFLSTWMKTNLQKTIFEYRLRYYSFYKNDDAKKRLQSFIKQTEIKSQNIPIDFLLKEPFNINAPHLSNTTDDIEMLLSAIWHTANALKENEREILMKHIGITHLPKNENEMKALDPRSYICILSNLTNKETYDDLALTAYLKYGVANSEWNDFIKIVSTKISNKKFLANINETQKKRLVEQEYLSKIKELPAANFSCEDINGQQVSLNQFKGKYILVDIWATWCGPCKGEIPSLQKQEEDFKEENVIFLSISLDSKKNDWSQFVHDKGLKGIQIFAGKESDAISKHYGVKGIPRFMLLDKEGKVLESDFLRPSEANFAKVLRNYLSK